ncbi:glycosyltransferase family 2 protein [Gallaecimonas xiamenensis]|uniref:Glycosyl transferase family protein n=1 Tax=Gallaecimonas xiamenensis 3-C-1 TaxID=745411 RepID=K2K1K5_9GAMM|nr:glycosyltransferase family 2 protein [Gallaecimonas xiamenensis]EKE76659.1 glycosyl transferase family protein [Gallaecimonas xiamenensis 3-C-1]
MSFKPCLVVPVYNHGPAAERTVPALLDSGLPLILVDDGSAPDHAQILDRLAAANGAITLVRHSQNQGKGGAVISGLKAAKEAGFSHALQVDADGQHALEDIPRFLAEAQAAPTSLIAGQPLYDGSVPKGRLYGRYLTHVWVWIETLGFHIKDSMCGFRVYPLAATVALLDKVQLGRRMDFDIEVMVRLDWAGVPIKQLKTRVIYPEDGASHFQAWRDNWLISKMHTRLVLGMLWRLPKLLGRKWLKPKHWSAMGERGSRLGMKTLWHAYRLFGRGLFRCLLWPVMAYFFLTGQSRRHSLAYLERLYQSGALASKPGLGLSFRHHLAFGESILDKLAAWAGKVNKGAELRFDGREHLDAIAASGQGALLVGAHLGNLELCRALSDKPMTVLVLTEHAAKFNQLLAEINPAARMNMLEVSQMGPDTAMVLRQRIDAGEMVIMVGDRTSASKAGHTVAADFLGQPAPFPIGPWVLAHVLECPVYLLFCTRQQDHYQVSLEPFAPEGISLERKTRSQALALWAARYSQRLAEHCRRTPLQWFNFFDFWQADKGRRQQDDKQ